MAYLLPAFARTLVVHGVTYRAGDALPDGLFTDFRLRQLRSLGWVKDLPVDGDAPDNVTGARFRVVALTDAELAERQARPVATAPAADPAPTGDAGGSEAVTGPVVDATAPAAADDVATDPAPALPAALG